GTRNFFPDADFNDPEFQRQTLQFEVNTRIFDQIRAAGMMGYDHAPQITVPTLVIQGNDDELVKPEITQKLLSRLNGDVIYTEVNAPHNPLDPEQDSWPEVVRAVEDYAKRFEMEVSS
ncbi:MAG: alpha/beta hydrolase, partial [Chloroflexota bacterium]